MRTSAVFRCSGKRTVHTAAPKGVNEKQTCLTHASPSAVMALLSKILFPPMSPPLRTHTHTHLLTSTLSSGSAAALALRA